MAPILVIGEIVFETVVDQIDHACPGLINSFRRSDAYMRHINYEAIIEAIAGLLITGPLATNYGKKIQNFHSRKLIQKYIQLNYDHFVSTSTCCHMNAVFPGIGISIMNIRRLSRLIFMMDIPILAIWCLYIETVP